MKRITLLLLSVLLIGYACTDEFDLFESEIDLTRDWEETIAIFSNLNLHSNIHYVRLNRGFAGDNFFISNTNPDSIYFDPSTTEVTLYKLRVNNISDGVITDADTLGVYPCRDTLIEKDTVGNFLAEKVLLYYTETKQFSVDDADDLYAGIEVVTPKRKVTSYTRIIEETEFDYPNRYLDRFPIENSTFDARIRKPLNSQLFQVEGYCSYFEVTNIDGQVDTTLKSFNFLMGSIRDRYPVVGYGEVHSWRESTELFYGGLERDVLKNGDTVNTIARMLDGIYFKGYAGNADLALITSNSSLTSGFSTESMNFTNVSNGLGYFSAYAVFNTDKFKFSQPTIDSVNDVYGNKYHFTYNFN